MLPYALELVSPILVKLKSQISLPTLIVLQTTQAAILFAITTFVGLFFAQRIGLEAPILDAKLKGEAIAGKIQAVLPTSIALGIVSTLIILGLEFTYFQPTLIQELGNAAKSISLQNQPAAWKGLLASFYGGIAEEILLRLFVMSFLAWIGSFISKTSDGKPTNTVFWIANILAAVLFGLGHLPATAMLIPLTPLVIIRAIVLNGFVGIACGWLYQTRGLESAMIAHFSADIVLHVLLAL